MAQKKGVLAEFKEFLLRGNVVDLAVAVVVGGAFGALVAAFVKDLITPFIGLPGKVHFADLVFQVRGSKFAYGDFINAVVTFLSIAAAIFFFVVKPLNALMARRKKRESEPEPESTTRPCPECLSEIPRAALRCAFCTAQVGAFVPAAEASPEGPAQPLAQTAGDHPA
ncbi:MAG: large conductance mechanosensitive channel protein MscL [Actinomycetota bacterium]